MTETIAAAKISDDDNLLISSSFYKSLFRGNKNIFLLIDSVSLNIADCSMSACAFYGYSHEMMLQMKLSDIENTIDHSCSVHIKESYKTHRLSDGRMFDVSVNASRIAIEGAPYSFLIVSDQKHMDPSADPYLQLHSSDHAALDHIKLSRVGDYAVNLIRKPAAGRPSRDSIPEKSVKWVEYIHKDAKSASSEKQKIDSGYKIEVTGSENRHFVHQLVEVGYDGQSDIIRVIGTIHDVTDRMQFEETGNGMHYLDHLTGLYNEKSFDVELKRLDLPENLPLSIIISDINGLSAINDSIGYAAGDVLLKNIAEIIRNGCRSNDIFARIGGDEFAIILPKASEADAGQIISRLKSQTLKEGIGSEDISISFGSGTKRVAETDIRAIIRVAEEQLNKKKLFEYPKAPLLKQVNKYINSHIAEEISLAGISATLYHSPNYFSKRFKLVTGIGFCDYVEQKRMERACFLLLTTDLKVTEIAVKVGYDSPTYFCRIFKTMYRSTPLEYRKS
jgi:diguanylate cyclase (GGDEF)-like protein